MEKQTIVVPKGIRYLSEWKEFTLPEHPCIINKQITGCGFTELCIGNQENVILCSPRKILLENKEEKHPEVLYVRNEFERPIAVDKDLGSRGQSTKEDSEEEESKDTKKVVTKEDRIKYYSNLKRQIFDYYLKCFNTGVPCKILVTYDSFRLVKEALGDAIKLFYVVIDEMQAVFCDAKFKGDTELDFVFQVQDLQKVCYVSATPMIDKYLEMLDEFKDLPYYELDWKSEDRHRVSRPELEVYGCSSIVSEALRIIDEYRSGKFISTVYLNDKGQLVTVESKEAVFYVNSVKNICEIIKKAGLTLDEMNILCANTPENKTKLRKVLGIKERGVKIFGKVPLEGEPHKMFTFCTRTVYLGADFCSTNARSFIFSDANIDCLSVDITLDLPQILGRQRLDCNPWKSRAELYFKSLKSVKEIDKMEELIEIKKQATEDLLLSYKNSPTEKSKRTLAEEFLRSAKTFNYRNHYVAVNTHGGKDLVPTCNMFVLAAEMRNVEIQKTDYKDRFSVFSAVEKENSIIGSDEVERALKEFDKLTQFPDRLKLVCTTGFSSQLQSEFLRQVPTIYSDYYYLLGPEKCKTASYRRSLLDKILGQIDVDKKVEFSTVDTKEPIYEKFEVGKRYTKATIKEMLREIYTSLGLSLTPKANQLSDYFELKRCVVPNKETGKADEGFEILRKI